MQIKPYLVVSTLIAQPTWGGDYIASFKSLHSPTLTGVKIGQAFELYDKTLLCDLASSEGEIYPFELQTPDRLLLENPAKAKIFGLQELIDLDPVAVLGADYLKKYGNTMRVLNKFTQAKGNSYQLHVKSPIGKWLPKPESWYYFEDGLVTLGIKDLSKIELYKASALKINAYLQDLSNRVKSGKISSETAQNLAKDFCKQENIEQFVNVLVIKAGQSIDLSKCGIHHSWEEDDERFPLGNIVYEVQENVADPVATIRSFDKGKIASDGSIRPLQIDEYFQHLDTSISANDPSTHMRELMVVKEGENYTITQVFDAQNYALQEIRFNGVMQLAPEKNFMHLFVREGILEFASTAGNLVVTQGNSIFVPANSSNIYLRSNKNCIVLKTYVK